MYKLILWNARSILNKKTELNYLTYKENPGILAINETWLKEKDTLNINNYTVIRKDRNNQIGGGLAVCIKKDIQHKKINLNDRYKDKIEVLGIKTSYKRNWLNILLIYNPCNVIEAEELEYYSDQIRHPKLIIGDFNAHHPLWNENTNQRQTNTTGTNITKWLSQNNVLLLTPRNLITRIDPKTAKESTLDLVFGSPALSHLQIKSASHQISDHLPIIIMDNTYIENHLLKEKKWYYTKERWKDYQKELNETNLEEISTIEEITEQIKNTALKYLKLETRQIIDKPNKPWWNKDCHETIKERNKAFNRWRKKNNYSKPNRIQKAISKSKTNNNSTKKEIMERFL